jgi:hypothetical protein
MRNLYWGFVLIAIGFLLLLDNLGVADFGDMIRDYWPLLLIFWGISMLLRRSRRATAQAAAGMAAGPAPAASGPAQTAQGWTQPAPGMDQAGGQAPAPSGFPRAESDLIHQSSVFGDIMVNVTSRQFRGGSISTVFGNSHIDLSPCAFADGEHELRIHGVFGDTKLILPPGAAVAISASCVLGDLTIFGQRKGGISSDIQHLTPDYSAAASRMKVTVSRVFGRISVE